MSGDLRDLYQEVILDHYKRPRNFRKIEGGRIALGHNPLCGDRITLYVQQENGRVKDVSFEGSGCAISTASASLMTEAIKGKTPEEAEELFVDFHNLVTGESDPDLDELGKLAVFAGVREFPVRVKCATLSWHTLRSALYGEKQPVTTEDATEV